MKTSTRVIFSIYIISVILLCLFLLLSLCNVISSDYLILAVKTMFYGVVWYKILYIIIFCAFIVFGIGLLFFGIKHTKHSVLIKTLDNGKILISYDTILQLVQRFIKSFESVSEDKIYLNIKKNQVYISVAVNIDGNSDIPEVTSSLHNGILNFINIHTGIDVCDCKIVVAQLNKEIHSVK